MWEATCGASMRNSRIYVLKLGQQRDRILHAFTEGAIEMSGTPPTEASQRDETRLLESLKLLKEWGTWPVTIQTAAIAAVGALIADPKPPLTPPQIWVGCFAVGLFISSIIFASWLIVALPGFYARNARSIYGEEFRDKPAFIFRSPQRCPIKLLYLMGGEHTAFVLGVAIFALFIGLRLAQGRTPL